MKQPQFAFYWHNGRSLGHTSESLKQIRALAALAPGEAHISALTGAWHGMEDLPKECDLLQLPRYRNTDSTPDHAPEAFARISYDDLMALRRELLAAYCRAVRPDVLVVNHEPLGQRSEMRDALAVLGPTCVKFLTLRGVLDSPARTNSRYFSGDGAEQIRAHYEELVVFCDPDVFDLCSYYDVPPDLAARVRHVGYPDSPRRQGSQEDLVVVTMGGGEAARSHWRSLLAGLDELHRRSGGLRVHLYPGPYCDRGTREVLAAWQQSRPSLRRVVDTSPVPDFGRASVVVAPAGASTISELLALGANSVLFGRQSKEREQDIHAQLLARCGAARYVDVRTADAARIADVLDEAMSLPPTLTTRPLLGGARRAAERYRRCAAGGEDDAPE